MKQGRLLRERGRRWLRELRAAARACTWGLALSMVMLPTVQAEGLGIGEPSRVSALLEPMKVEIPLQLNGVPPEDVRIELGLDTVEGDARVRPSGGAALRSEIVVDASGRALLRVSTVDRVRDPILHLRVDLSGAGVQVRRELTLLFDPPPSPTMAAAPVKLPESAESNVGLSAPGQRPATAANAGGKPASHPSGKAPARRKPSTPLRAAEPLPTTASTNIGKPVTASIGSQPSGLKLADDLSSPSRALVNAAPANAPAANAQTAVPAAGTAAPVQDSGAAAPASPTADSAPASSPPLAEELPPAASSVHASPAPVNESGRGLPAGWLLGLLAVAVLAFGWLFWTLRTARARRADGPSKAESVAWNSDHEIKDTLLELGRDSRQPMPHALHTRDAVTVNYIDQAEQHHDLPPEAEAEPHATPAPPAVEQASRKPLQGFPEEWSPDDFDLSQPLEDKRPGR